MASLNSFLHMADIANQLNYITIERRIEGETRLIEGEAYKPEHMASNAMPVTIFGYTNSVTWWARRLGTARQTLRRWIREGQNLEKIAARRGVTSAESR